MAKKAAKIIEDKSVILENVLEDVMHDSMLPYSESVILDRALPRVEDGLKPVQRRILFAMHEMGLTPDKPYKKCARIVGDCMGKYHPHGDSSVYGALVRMAQPFSMRVRLVDGHGNFGSIDGDSAAAMRYTEARMSSLALELLRDLDKDTVSWTPNFDDSMQEPVILPGRFPNLLVNGADGIAVGLATKIPPHNLGEVIDAVVAMIDNSNIGTNELLKFVKGPDFPTGAIIIPVDPLEDIYETGKGRIKIRSRFHIEDEGNDKKSIVLTELPFQVSKSELLTKIADLRENNKEILSGISDIVDESDKNGIRAVIKLKRDTDIDAVIDFLLKKTNIEISYSINIVAIANGKPEQLGLKDILKYYVNYQREIIKRRTAHDLKIAKDRCEIVKGLMIAVQNIDAVIKIIKSSENTAVAKDALRKKFDLSDVQAQAILDMRLKALTHLEIGKLEEELKELEKTIAFLSEIMSSSKRQLQVVRQEILEIKKAHKVGRYSVISLGQDEVYASTKSESVQFKEGVLTLNPLGHLRFMSQKSFVTGFKDISVFANLASEKYTVNNLGNLFAFTNLGNVFKISVDSLPEKKWRDKATLAGQLNPEVKLGEDIVKLFFFDEAPVGELVFLTQNGMVKRTDWSEFAEIRSFAQAINLTDDDKLLNVSDVSAGENILTITKEGMSLIYRAADVPLQSRKAGGVKGIKLNDTDKVVFAELSDDEGEVVIITENSNAKRVIIPSLEVGNRYLKGVKIVDLADNKVIFASIVKTPYNIALLQGEDVTVVNTEDIRIDTRTTKGKTLSKSKIDKAARICDVKE